MSISASEFEALQLQLIELKEAKYESQDREKKLHNEIKLLREQVSNLESESKKTDSSKAFAALSGVITNNKNKDKKAAALQSENEALTRNLELASQEHKEQQDATMQMVKNLHTTNKSLEEEIENLKKAALERDRKVEVQEGQLRKLQIQLLQYEGSADVLKSNDDNHGGESTTKPPHDGTGEQHGEKPEGEGAGNHNLGKLEEENGRLRDNVRLLSTQFKTLDEQLSKSEESYRSQISELELQLSTSREKIKQDEIASARMEARLEESIEKLQKEKEGLATKIVDLEEQSKKDKLVANQVDDLKDQITDLSDRLTILTTSRDEYMEQAKRETAECESVSRAKSVLEAQLAELEAEAELLRKVRDEHSVILGQFESTKTVVKNLEISLDRANTECAQLAEAKKELEQVRLELESVNAHATSLQAELETLKAEVAQLRTENGELDPLRQSLEASQLQTVHAKAECDTLREQYEAERHKLIDAESSLQDMSAKLYEANEQVSSLTAQVTQLQTEKEDMSTEYKIEERKNQRMIKELKSELQKERTSMSRSVSMEQFPSVPASPATTSQRHSPPMSPVPLTPPPTTPQMNRHHQLVDGTPAALSTPSTPASMHGTPRLNRQQAEAVNSLPLLTPTVSNMELSPSTMEELLRRDLDTALTMVGKLGEDKWKLEEKARFLEENLALVNEDLVRKTQVIQHYVSRTKLTVTPDQLEKGKSSKQSGIRGTLQRAGVDQGSLSVEMLAKMEAVLEETVLKNIQLQKDMETLGNETGTLQKEMRGLVEDNKQLANENRHYKDQLVRLMSNPHI